MHDPMTIAHEIRSPIPEVRTRRPGPGKPQGPRWNAHWYIGTRELYFPPLITIWHREPDDQDSGTVCTRDTNWRWHADHWEIHVDLVKKWRRRIMTRCTECGGRSTKADPVNVSHQWESPYVPWWHPEQGLYHRACSAKVSKRDRDRYESEKNLKEWDQSRAAISALRGVLKEIEQGPGNHLAVITLMSRIQCLTDHLNASQKAAREARRARCTEQEADHA